MVRLSPAAADVRAIAKAIEDAGADVLYRESPMQHAIDPRFLLEVGALLGRTEGASRE